MLWSIVALLTIPRRRSRAVHGKAEALPLLTPVPYGQLRIRAAMARQYSKPEGQRSGFGCVLYCTATEHDFVCNCIDLCKQVVSFVNIIRAQLQVHKIYAPR